MPLLRHAECERILDTAYNFGTITSNTANINTAVERVSKIVFALRAFSRVEQTGQMQLCDLREGIETVLMIYRGQLRLHIELVRDYEEIAPIMCLPDELNQVWTNLIHNALQAMQYKGRLSIAISRQENQAVVSIADTGCGIPLADRETYF